MFSVSSRTSLQPNIFLPLRPEMGKYMFADPLDLIMINVGGTFVPMSPHCPRRLSVLYLINLSELEMAPRLPPTEVNRP